MPGSLAALVLAGGEARRFPGKLGRDLDGTSVLERAIANARTFAPHVYVAVDAAFDTLALRAMDVTPIVDTEPRRGPLGGIVAALPAIAAPTVVLVAGDAPFVDAAFVARLTACRRDGDEAVVPRQQDGGETFPQPLAALYDRDALARAAAAVYATGRGKLRLVLEYLAVRYLDVAADDSALLDIDSAAALERAQRTLAIRRQDTREHDS